MLFIKTHETVNCNSTLRQLFIFFFLCSTSAMLRYLKVDTGGLAVAAAWLAFHHLFFLGLMGCGESFCLAVAQLLLSMQNQALFSLLCFCYAQLCHD
jgi:Flp pilus assembly protein protease CpaA